MGIKYLRARSALAIAGLLVGGCAAGSMSADGGKAQVDPDDVVQSEAAAAKLCRAEIVEGGSGQGVGPVEFMRGAKPAGFTRKSYPGPEDVRESNVRMFRALIQGTNMFGVTYKRYLICFFEQRGSSYRFVQTCSTESEFGGIVSCDLRWIVSDLVYDRWHGGKK